MKKIITIVILFLSIQLSHAQWTKGKGNGYFKVSGWYLEANEHYTNNGGIDPNATRSVFFTNLYGEYGLNDRLDAIAFIPAFARVTQNDQVSGTTGDLIQKGEGANSIGDLDIGFRYGIVTNGKYLLSASLMFGIPTGNDKGGSDGSFQTGDGEFNQLLKLDFGGSFSLFKKPAYFKTSLGFNQRSEGFSDEIRSGLELGWNVIEEKLWLSTKINIQKSLENGELDATNSQGSIFANNIEYVNVGVEASYYIKENWGVTAHFDGALSGRLIYAAPSIGGGIFYDLK